MCPDVMHFVFLSCQNRKIDEGREGGEGVEKRGVLGFQEEEEYCGHNWLHRHKEANPRL